MGESAERPAVLLPNSTRSTRPSIVGVRPCPFSVSSNENAGWRPLTAGATATSTRTTRLVPWNVRSNACGRLGVGREDGAVERFTHGAAEPGRIVCSATCLLANAHGQRRGSGGKRALT